ncbi:MAG: hypothetical protein RJA57_1042 [Bacteroidota bacterium]
MKHILFFTGSIALLLTACKTPQEATTQTQTRIQQQTANSYTLDVIKDGIYQKPVVADLEIGKDRLTLTKTYENTSLDKAKENITSEFSDQNSCDIVVQPVYLTNTTITDTENKITITLIGTPAVFRNIRTWEPGDNEAFLIHNYLGAAPVVAKKDAERKVTNVVTTKTITKKAIPKERTRFGIAAEYASVSGEFRDDINSVLGFTSGYGGTFMFVTPFNKAVGLNINAGLLRFRSDYDPNVNFISGNIGIRFKTPGYFFFQPNAGFTQVTSSNEQRIKSQSRIGVGAAAGVSSNRVEFSLRWDKSISGYNSTFYAARLGFFF